MREGIAVGAVSAGVGGCECEEHVKTHVSTQAQRCFGKQRSGKAVALPHHIQGRVVGLGLGGINANALPFQKPPSSAHPSTR